MIQARDTTPSPLTLPSVNVSTNLAQKGVRTQCIRQHLYDPSCQKSCISRIALYRRVPKPIRSIVKEKCIHSSSTGSKSRAWYVQITTSYIELPAVGEVK
jgi:hypothetical protein